MPEVILFPKFISSSKRDLKNMIVPCFKFKLQTETPRAVAHYEIFMYTLFLLSKTKFLLIMVGTA